MTALLRDSSVGKVVEYLRDVLRDRTRERRMSERGTIISFEDLYQEQLQDMHSCERQLTGAWVRLADTATHPQLKVVLGDLPGETKRHLGRLHRILSDLDTGPDRAVCRVTSAVIAEGCNAVGNGMRGTVCDACILCAGQKLQHHQIATYASLSVLSELLVRRSDHTLLNETLREEQGTQCRFAALSAAYVAVLTYPTLAEAGKPEPQQQVAQQGDPMKSQESLAHA